ncbi:Hypothetical predicted protein [Pelobates cultripes]|uniref:Uncharacterized protein n=1 Tax=Pelobates cultripes TaxID=61616 RepID=A0AAD1RRS6_PELCU|nr:Hypothetical predicted protein [Pelobates cultripes]
METFDRLCTSFKDTLLSRGATYRQAESLVTKWKARHSYYKQTPCASKMVVRQYRYQRAQRWKMAAGMSGALFRLQIKTPGITKQITQTSTSPVQHLGIQRSKNRLYTKKRCHTKDCAATYSTR